MPPGLSCEEVNQRPNEQTADHRGQDNAGHFPAEQVDTPSRYEGKEVMDGLDQLREKHRAEPGHDANTKGHQQHEHAFVLLQAA